MNTSPLLRSPWVRIGIPIVVAIVAGVLWITVGGRLEIRSWIQTIEVAQQDGGTVLRAHYSSPQLGDFTREVSSREWLNLYGDLRLKRLESIGVFSLYTPEMLEQEAVSALAEAEAWCQGWEKSGEARVASFGRERELQKCPGAFRAKKPAPRLRPPHGDYAPTGCGYAAEETDPTTDPPAPDAYKD